MTLTATDRGVFAASVGGANRISASPASNCTAGALIVLCCAYDNSGTNGADPFSTISDTKGNTWTSRVASLNDPGAANAGIAVRIFTTSQNGGALTTSDVVTVGFGGLTTVSRAWSFIEFTSDVGVPVYKNGGQETAATASPTITTGTIPAGHAVVGCIGREGNDAVSTEDTDSTNGTWSTAQAQGAGTTTSGAQIITQQKITTGSGTQTYNPTYGTSRDGCEAWVEIGEAITVTPPAASLVTTTFAPTVSVSDNKKATPPAAALAITTFPPTVLAPRVVTPPAAALVITTFPPTVLAPRVVTPPAATLAITTFPPTVLAPRVVTPPAAGLVLTTFPPTVTVTLKVTPPAAALSLTTFAPSVLIGVTGVGAGSFPLFAGGSALPSFSTEVRVSAFRALVIVRPYDESVTPAEVPDVFPPYLLPNVDAPVRVTTSWDTDITTAVDTRTEERRALLDRPEREIVYSNLGMLRHEANAVFMFGNRRAVHQGKVPIVPDGARVIETESDRIHADVSLRRFCVGQMVLIHSWEKHRPANISIRTITDIPDDRLSIGIAPDLEYVYPEGSRVLPLIDSDIQLDVDMKAITDEDVEITIDAVEVPGPSVLPPLAPDNADVYALAPDGHPILGIDPDWEGGIDQGFSRDGEDINLGRSHMTIGEGPRGSWRATLPFKMRRPEWWTLLRFFDSRQGRRRPFWVIAFNKHMRVVSVVDSHVDIEAMGSIDDAQDFGTALGFLLRDGRRVIRGVDEITDNNDGTWRIELDDVVAELVGASIRRVGWSHLVRWDTDAFEESWSGQGVVEVDLPVMEVPDERSVDIPHIEKDLQILEGIPADDLDLYLWLESNQNAWEGNSESSPATQRVYKSDTEKHWHGDFWDDVRLDAGKLYPDGEFPNPYLYRGLSSDSHGPFYVRFNKKKTIFKGKPVWEHGGSTGAGWKLSNDDLHFWSGQGFTIMCVVCVKKDVGFSPHKIIDRPGVLVWDTNHVKMWSVLGVDDPLEWMALPPGYMQVVQRTYALRWEPGVDLRLWRGGKLIAQKTTNVVSALPLDPIPTDVFRFFPNSDGKAGFGNYKTQAFSMALRIYRRPISAAEMNAVAKKWKKAYGAKWGNVSGF